MIIGAMSDTSAPVRQALRDALPGAMKARDTPSRNAIRSALAAIENAEAVPVDEAGAAVASSEHVAGAALGVGAAEVRRRELDEEQILEIVSSERNERLVTAAELRALGQHERATELETEAAALDAFLC